MASSITFVPFLLSSYILLLLPLVIAQNTASNSSINLGNSITATEDAETWNSPSNEFAFGFHQLENKDLFLLAIWYLQIPSRTIVWYAKVDNPVPRRSKAELTADRGLVLSDPNGQEIWRSDFPTGEAAYARMNDIGNFVVYNGSNEPLWESFNNPTDTLLPTQVMNINDFLSSRYKENNFSKGRFQFRLRPDGNVVLNEINLESSFAYDAYYTNGSSDAEDPLNSGYQVRLDQNGSFHIWRRNNQSYSLIPKPLVPSEKNYFKVTLNFDGVLTLSSYPKGSTDNNANWTVINDPIPNDICSGVYFNVGGLGSGACGYNSKCILRADKRPACECPPEGYSLSDPNNEYGNCQPDFMPACESDEQSSPQDLWKLVEMPNTNWPFSDYERITPCNSLDDCKTNCLQDCLCVAAVFNGRDCWKKTLPLRYGRYQQNAITIIKVRKGINPAPVPPPYAKKDQNNSLMILVSVLFGGSVFVNFVLIGLLCMGSFFLYHKMITINQRNENGIERSLRYFNYKELEEATNCFSEELGRGSFGIVYKGVIKLDSQDPTQVAVKKLDRVAQDKDKEFRTEVRVIAQTHHRNLVRLIGYCDEGQYRMLVYEYLSNRTLASFLFGDPKPSWNRRIQIALGIARGLAYLHEDCNPQIIHCDIKPQNILLDDYYEARISDFGLSKLLGINESYTNTGIRGTKGYVAPEWFKTVPVSVKVDVYSFGVLLLEIICCRRNVEIDFGAVDQKPILTDLACDCFFAGSLDTLVQNDAEALSDKLRLKKFVMVAIWCIQEDFSLRPTMKNVILMLEGTIQVPAPPCRSSFL